MNGFAIDMASLLTSSFNFTSIVIPVHRLFSGTDRPGDTRLGTMNFPLLFERSTVKSVEDSFLDGFRVRNDKKRVVWD